MVESHQVSGKRKRGGRQIDPHAPAERLDQLLSRFLAFQIGKWVVRGPGLSSKISFSRPIRCLQSLPLRPWGIWRPPKLLTQWTRKSLVFSHCWWSRSVTQSKRVGPVNYALAKAIYSLFSVSSPYLASAHFLGIHWFSISLQRMRSRGMGEIQVHSRRRMTFRLTFLEITHAIFIE